MPDEIQRDAEESASAEKSEASAAVAETEEGEEKPAKLDQKVDIVDAGPCLKHIKVSIPWENIKDRLNKKFSEMMPEVQVPGYRPGKAPRRLIEKRFAKDVGDQLKTELVLQSLEELAEAHHLNVITQPNIDPFKIEMPHDAPLQYEFEIEVAPQFDLPQYKGLRLRRPVKTITEPDVQEATKNFLRRFGVLKPKDAPATLGDYLIADIHIHDGESEISHFKDLTIRIDPQLAFKDGTVSDFGAKMVGAKNSESRKADILLSSSHDNPNLRGRRLSGTFEVKEVKELVLPELDEDFLTRIGAASVDDLHSKVRSVLVRQMEYEQRQAARQQVLEHIAAAATWDLPQDLLRRQAYKTLQRRVLEMRRSGFSEDDIRSRSNLLQQDAVNSTAIALKEHFVLQKIAEVEKLEIDEDDVETEIETLAAQSDESPRRVRARLEKEGLMDTLMTEIIERKALDLVLASAEYEDVPMQPQGPAVAAVEEQAAPAPEPEPEKPSAPPQP
jgi:trigger factor